MNIITTTAKEGSLHLLPNKKALEIIIDPADYIGVKRSASDLGKDFFRVSASTAHVVEESQSETAIIAGTYGKNRIITELVDRGELDRSLLANTPEAFIITVIDHPTTTLDRALVIAGSDKRGTIYGIYEVSAQLGVHPWHFWLDVPPTQHQDLYALKDVVIADFPRVRYRGIFLNDEAPALTNWIRNTYGDVPPSLDPPIPEGIARYGHEFYTKLFEVILRLKGNFLLPAIWNNAFFEDDPENARLADEYGIVMGTSHQEPMTRAQQEWDRRYRNTHGHWDYSRHSDLLKEFWKEGIERNKAYETVVTIGLRGADDTPMAEGGIKENRALLEHIVDEQRKIISEVTQKPASETPQLWCLYKEVQHFYEDGMQVPDDVTLLWADDNWGNLRRVPSAEERKRSGGAGIYYHFDYHGDPRNYQWINTTQIAKIWEQMSLAYQYEADRIWVVNVGHFKGQEQPISFFLDLAWNPTSFEAENLHRWSQQWVASLFGDVHAEEIADLLERIVELNARRKPELLSPQTWSLINYNESTEFVEQWQSIQERARELAPHIPPPLSDTYYHLILFPANSSTLLAQLYQAAGRNQLWATQGRYAANREALRVQELFEAFQDEIETFQSTCSSGRWRGFMDQAVLGYIDWNDPPFNCLDHIYTSHVFPAQYHRLGVAVEGSTESWPSLKQCALPLFDSINDQKYHIEVFNRSDTPFSYHLVAADPWIKTSTEGGTIKLQERIEISIDWTKVPSTTAHSILSVSTGERYKDVPIHIEVHNINEDGIVGFVEADRSLAINAINYQQNIASEEAAWVKLPTYKQWGGVRAEGIVDLPHSEYCSCVCYEAWFTHTGEATFTVVVSPVLNFTGNEISIGLSVDDQEPVTLPIVEAGYTVELDDEFWRSGVIANARMVSVNLPITKTGPHTIKVWLTSVGVVVERIIVDLGSVRPSTLGPPQSPYRAPQ